MTIACIPSGAVAPAVERFPDAAIVAFVPRRQAMDSSHVGLVFRRNGWTLRHANSTKGRVVDEPFLAYVRRRERSISGIVVMSLRAE